LSGCLTAPCRSCDRAPGEEDTRGRGLLDEPFRDPDGSRRGEVASVRAEGSSIGGPSDKRRACWSAWTSRSPDGGQATRSMSTCLTGSACAAASWTSWRTAPSRWARSSRHDRLAAQASARSYRVSRPRRWAGGQRLGPLPAPTGQCSVPLLQPRLSEGFVALERRLLVGVFSPIRGHPVTESSFVDTEFSGKSARSEVSS
jgi:hypothetical protein